MIQHASLPLSSDGSVLRYLPICCCGSGTYYSEELMTDHIKHVPANWTFKNQEVADGFDAHVREQLPWYELVTKAIVQIGRHYIGERGLVYDIGASTGNIGRALEDVIIARRAELVAIEESPEMAKLWHGPGVLSVSRAQDYQYERFDLAVAMLCLIFNRPDEVAPLLARLVDQIRPGGALILVERMLPPTGYLSIVSSRLTLAAKMEAGATADEVVVKELSLAGAQRPLDPRLLEYHGAIEWFRYGDFAGYVIESKHDPWHPTLEPNKRDGIRIGDFHAWNCPANHFPEASCTCEGVEA